MLKSKKEKKEEKVKLNIGVGAGATISLLATFIGVYYRYIEEINISIALGDVGSISKSLLLGFALSSGKCLLYLGVYGLILSLVLKKNEGLKEFYSYYVLALIFIGLGSLIYFLI